MDKIKLYIIYGFLYAIAVSIILVVGISIIEKFIRSGMNQISIILFGVFWAGGILIGFIRGELSLNV